MAIYITGDTHGGKDIEALSEDRFPNYENCTKKDYLIVLGDWGYMFTYNPSNIESDEEFTSVEDIDLRRMLVSERKRLHKVFTNKKYTTLIILGNHDNYDRIEAFPEIDMLGGKVKKFNDSIFILKRGEVYNIDGYKFFVFGGATSLDAHFRTAKINWWEQEICTLEEEIHALENLQKNNNKVDFILTHTCSKTTLDKLLEIKFALIRRYDNHNYFLEKIKNTIEYKYWFFGHMHRDYRLDEKEFMVYNDILNLEEILKQDEENPYKRFTFF